MKKKNGGRCLVGVIPLFIGVESFPSGFVAFARKTRKMHRTTQTLSRLLPPLVIISWL
jgi:hypothetical protein